MLAGVSSEDKGHRPPGKGSLEPEATPPGKRMDKVRVPVRYCMLGSRDSARSVTPSALVLASLEPLVGLIQQRQGLDSLVTESTQDGWRWERA